MPDKQAAAAVPLFLLMSAAAIFGIVAQIGVTLALGIARSRAQFVGFCMLSMVFSGGATVLLHMVGHMDATVAATIGAMSGAVPSLITLRVGLVAVGKRVGVELSGEAAQLTPGGAK